MSDEKIVLIEDMNGEFRVCLEYEEHWTDVTAWEVVATDAEGVKPYFQRKDAAFRPDCVETTEEAERYLVGFIKWDGCSEFKFAPDEDMNVSYGHFHWCGPRDYRKHFRLLETLYKRAQALMASGNWEPWDSAEQQGESRET